MHTLLFIPGILGVKLKLKNKEIWPPNVIEALTHYTRVKQLLTRDLVPTGVFSRLACVPIYSPLEKTLAAIAKKIGAKVEPFNYDWRLDWRDTAKALGKKLERLAKSNSEISIVGHSMGAMIARLTLENPWENPSWRPQVKKLIAICAPHLGAPHAVADALGLYGMASGIVRRSDTKKIAADPRYPSGYQLFTRPNRPVVFLNTWEPLNLYDCPTARELELSCKNTDAARDMFPLLDLSRKPPGCDYRFIAANGYSRTIDSLDTKNKKTFTEIYYEGDGTVPIWSSNPPSAIPTYTMKGDHLGVIKTAKFKATLYQLFGLKAPSEGVFMVKGTPLVTLSLEKFVYDRGERINILLIPSRPTRKANGIVQLLRATNQTGRSWTPLGSPIEFEFGGLDMESFRTSYSAPDKPGYYKLIVEGSHATDNETAAYFAVRKESRSS